MEEIQKALEGVKYIPISVEEFISYLKYKEADLKSNPANFGEKDAPLNNEPFFHNDYEHRLLQFRYHLLKALGFDNYEGGWKIFTNGECVAFVSNEYIKAGTDSDFLEAIEATGVKLIQSV